jgi:hypothetical protein
VIQLSRIFGLTNTSTRNFGGYCVTESPLCLGLIIHSITLYRI